MSTLCFVLKYRTFKHIYQLITKCEDQYLSCFLCTLDYKVVFRQTHWEAMK